MFSAAGAILLVAFGTRMLAVGELNVVPLSLGVNKVGPLAPLAHVRAGLGPAPLWALDVDG